MSDQPKQLLHMVFGGHVKDPRGVEFDDLSALDIVGIYPNKAEALNAWRNKSQANVDDAHMKYVLVHMHKLLDDPEHEK
ncbi:MAG: inositol monophosphatase [Rhodospirillaceae bacterium]|nr:MAG: inositol monophosphatase [Rhodospirillaceae bacterium]